MSIQGISLHVERPTLSSDPVNQINTFRQYLNILGDGQTETDREREERLVWARWNLLAAEGRRRETDVEREERRLRERYPHGYVVQTHSSSYMRTYYPDGEFPDSR